MKPIYSRYMATKTKKKIRPTKENLKKIRNLEADLKYTLRAIDGKNAELDHLFSVQAEKIRKEINGLS